MPASSSIAAPRQSLLCRRTLERHSQCCVRVGLPAEQPRARRSQAIADRRRPRRRCSSPAVPSATAAAAAVTRRPIVAVRSSTTASRPMDPTAVAFRLKTQTVDARALPRQALVGIDPTTGDCADGLVDGISAVCRLPCVEARAASRPPAPRLRSQAAAPRRSTPAAARPTRPAGCGGCRRDTVGGAARRGVAAAVSLPAGLVPVADRAACAAPDRRSGLSQSADPGHGRPGRLSRRGDDRRRRSRRRRRARRSRRRIHRPRAGATGGQFRRRRQRRRAARALTVDEIIARHQAAAARQAAVSAADLDRHADADVRGAGVPRAGHDHVARRPSSRAAATRPSIEQRDIRVNGDRVQRRTACRGCRSSSPSASPSPPLAITLTDVYRYGSTGASTIAGTPCYIVAFEPVDARARRCSRGTRVDRDGQFAMVRVSAAQTALRGPIVASEQTDEFSAGRARGAGCSRARTCGRPTKGPAYRTPIHRVLVDRPPRHEPAGLRRAPAPGAMRRTAVMLRDTPRASAI